MKKLLALALVMGMASLASAGYTLSYDADQIIVGNDAELSGGINVQIGAIGGALVAVDDVYPAMTFRTASAPLTAKTMYYAFSGPSATTYEMPYTGGVLALAWGDSDGAGVINAAGEWMRVAFAGYQLGTADNYEVQIDLLDMVNNVTTSMYLVPEPMTMVLLGLGGLFLRKRS